MFILADVVRPFAHPGEFYIEYRGGEFFVEPRIITPAALESGQSSQDLASPPLTAERPAPAAGRTSSHTEFAVEH